MRELNLTADGTAQERILAYLKVNVSDTLAEKINNGVSVEKDGKSLISKKTLDGFMKYASEEARKLAGKGATCVCIDDDTVYGWAIHYFEEDSIQGTLYNLDGTKYIPALKTPPVAVNKPKQPNGQTSLFDLIEKQLDNKEEYAEENETQEQVEIKPKNIQANTKVSEFYLKYSDIQSKYPQDIILNRLGDFYEAFADSAVAISKELDLTLTGRDFGLDERVPMAGFPYHVAENYFNKLRSNHSIVVIEQEEIQRLAQTIKTNDGDTVELDTGEVLDCQENNLYFEIISNLLENKIKYVR